MIFHCVSHCLRTFDSEPGLTTHQRKCVVFSQNNSSFAGLAARQVEQKARKRRRLEDDTTMQQDQVYLYVR